MLGQVRQEERTEEGIDVKTEWNFSPNNVGVNILLRFAGFLDLYVCRGVNVLDFATLHCAVCALGREIFPIRVKVRKPRIFVSHGDVPPT